MGESTSVAFVGMTHLGLVYATGTAAKGLRVVGVDPDAELVANLDVGTLPIVEPGLERQLKSNGDHQCFSSDFSVLRDADIVYIAPDVPTDDVGQSDLSRIDELVAQVIPELSSEALLVVLCQVPPGYTRAVNFDKDRLFYQVETLVFGNALERALYPERLIIGSADPDRELPQVLRNALSAFDCPILNMRYESAELAKISINMCLVASISVANTMAEICEGIGADWHEIAPALKLDRRIGEFSYLSPGLGIAGGNLERDLASVVRIGAGIASDTGVVEAWIKNSQHRRQWVINETLSAGLGDKSLAVWGLAYKENTHSVKNSPSLATISALPNAGFQVHDPVVRVEKDIHQAIVEFDDPLDALSDAAALLVMTPWPVYRDIEPQDIAARMSGQIVLDPYRVLSPKACAAAGLSWRTLGRSEIE